MIRFVTVLVANLLSGVLLAIAFAYIEPDVSLWGGLEAVVTPWVDNLILINLLGIGLIIVWAFLGQFSMLSDRRILSGVIATQAGASVCFLVIAGIYFSYEQFAEINQPRKLLFIAWLLPFLSAMLLQLFKPGYVKGIWAVQGLFVIVFIIVLDTSYHVSTHRNPVAGIEQYVYHWNTKRRAINNYKNTPVHYIDEIQKLSRYIPSNSRFFADKYTSYYIKSVLPVYSINAKSHHRNHRRYSISSKTIEMLCKPEISDSDFNTIFAEILALDTDFAVINHDRSNSWLGTDCIHKNSGLIEGYLERNYVKVFQGAVLSAYKLK